MNSLSVDKTYVTIPLYPSGVEGVHYADWPTRMKTIECLSVPVDQLGSLDEGGAFAAMRYGMPGASYVVWSSNYIDGDGTYVVSSENDLVLRRLEFSVAEGLLRVRNEDGKELDVLPIDNNNMVILGKFITFIGTDDMGYSPRPRGYGFPTVVT